MVRNQKRIEQIAGLVVIGAIVIGCGFVLRPFVSAILWAAVLCFATWPLHELLLRWFRGRHNLTAAAMTALLSLVLIIPFLLVGLTFTDSVRSTMEWIDAREPGSLPALPAWIGRMPLAGGKITEYWANLPENTEPVVKWLKPRSQTAGLWLLRHSLDFARGLFQLVMSVLIAFFFYRDGEKLVVRLRDMFERISGDYARQKNRPVLFITERAVFRLTASGLELVEIAPGIDLQRDIFNHMAFKPAVSPDLRQMPAAIFK